MRIALKQCATLLVLKVVTIIVISKTMKPNMDLITVKKIM